MSTIDEILELLKDEKWHDLSHLKKKIRLQEFEVEAITNFLAEYQLIQLDKEQKKAKISPTLLNFLKKIQRIGEE